MGCQQAGQGAQASRHQSRRFFSGKSRDIHQSVHQDVPYRLRVLPEHADRIAPVQIPGDPHVDPVVDRNIAHLVSRIKNSGSPGQQNQDPDHL